MTGNNQPSRRAQRDRWPLLSAGAAITVVILLVSAAAPQVALGGLPSPLGLDPLKGLGDAITGGFGSMAVEAFDAIIGHLFAPISKLVTAELIGWLVEIPTFTGGHVGQLENTIVAMGGGLLGAVATLAVVRYWLVGLAGDGFGALEGLARTIAAALALAMWPWAFAQAVELTNLFTGSLLGADSVVKPSAELLSAGLSTAIGSSSNPLGLFLGLLIAGGASVLFLALLVLKVALSVSTLLVFVGMPLGIVLWPVAPAVPGLIGRAFIACLAIPVAWAICFATSAVIVLDSLRFTGGGSAIDKLLKPLVAIVLLYIMVKLPTGLARAAMVGGQALRGGFVARTAGYTARRRASNAVEDHLRDTQHSHTRTVSHEHGSRSQHQPARPASTPAAGGTPRPGGSNGGSTGGRVWPSPNVGPRPAGYTPPPSAHASTARQDARRGLPTPAFRKDDFEAELFEAEHRQRNAPVSPDQARAAAQALPATARRAVAAAVSASSGDGARRELAYRATAGEWTPDEREALRTLAAATPDVRSQALTILDEHDGSPAATAPSGEPPAPREDAAVHHGHESESSPAAGPHPEHDSGVPGVAPREQQHPAGPTGASPGPRRERHDPAADTGAPAAPPREQREPRNGGAS